ncbi:MAG: tetratricopeptide repeat protein [Planctomycetota bacterium]
MMLVDDPQAIEPRAASQTSGDGVGLAKLAASWPIVGGIVLLTFAAYLPALRGDFLISDDSVITQNPRLTAPDGLRRIWFSTESEQYQPLLYTSFWLERRIWGLNPCGYHLVNLMLHTANALLIWWLLRRIGAHGAALAAMLFALHPVNVESVAWIYERKNVLSGLFYFLSFAALLQFTDWCRWSCYGIALVLFAAALLTKTSTVVLPLVLLLYWWWRRDVWRWRTVVASLPFFVLAGGMAALTVWYERHHTGASGAEFTASFAERFARAGWIVAFYAGKCFLPVRLMFFYPRWSADPRAAFSYVPHALLALVLLLLIIRRHTWGRPVLFGLGAYLLALVPVLGFFDIYYQQFSFVADHFQYLALVGLIGLCVHGATYGLERSDIAGIDPVTGRTRLGGRALGVGLLGACWFLAGQRAQVFQNTGTLCADTLRHNPNSWIANYERGEYVLVEGRGRKEAVQLALTHFQRALQHKPDHAYTLEGLGLASGLLGRGEEALDYLRRAVAAAPNNAVFQMNLGSSLEQRYGPAAAIDAYHEAVRCRPTLLAARLRLARALLRQGQLPEALEHAREASRLSPNDPGAAALLRELEGRPQAPSVDPAQGPR